jgi:hypothetical protein
MILHYCQSLIGGESLECAENPQRENELEIYLGEYYSKTNFCPFCGYKNKKGNVIDYLTKEVTNQ